MEHHNIGHWDFTYDNKPGRRRLRLDATTPKGDIVSVEVENYPTAVPGEVGVSGRALPEE